VSGISPRTLNLYTTVGGADPKIGKVAAVAKVCGVSLDYLMDMEAPAGASPVAFRLGKAAATAIAEIDGVEDIVQVPILDVRVAAGSGSWNSRSETIGNFPFSRRYLRKLGIDPANVHALQAHGDSMFPTISDGALVLVDTSAREIQSDGIYVFVAEDFARIKRLQRGLDGSLNFISDNPAYPPERVSRAQLQKLDIAGRAFWCDRAL
jgi:phage repressor protein C with HTH and peptisase S24 domain